LVSAGAPVVMLTEVVPYDMGKKTPLMVEVPVDRDLAPYLVTSTKASLWIERPHPNNCVRAAVCAGDMGEHCQLLVQEIALKGDAEGWGNCQSLTPEGVKAALQHLDYYGFSDVEVLFSTTTKTVGVPEGVPVGEALWVPPGWAVVVPVDRGFVGTTLRFKEDRLATVVHNAARAVVVLIGEAQ